MPQGTGFMASTPVGGLAAVTASHFINTQGAPLMRVAWIDMRDGTTIENLTNSWGPPGRGGVTQLKMMDIDLRTDYLVLPITATVASERTLELDERSMPESGERVWFPNKDPETSEGFDLLEGHLREVHIKYHVVILDTPIAVRSQSGTPVISQVTGKVVGIISRDGREYGMNMLGENLGGRIFLLTPSATIFKVFTAYSEHPSLSRVTGKQ